ncbi:NAD(P)-dependent oxidoreductase, partial [Clostridioides difficile]
MLYPINLKLDELDVVIIGGGEVAYRKCKNFLEFNKNVT